MSGSDVKNTLAQHARTDRKRNMSSHDVEGIVTMLAVWQGRLTWDLLIKRVAQQLGRSPYTRQALYMHPEIRQAFQLRKKGETVNVRPDRKRPVANDFSPELGLELLHRIRALQSQVDRLEIAVASLIRVLHRMGVSSAASPEEVDRERDGKSLKKGASSLGPGNGGSSAGIG
jgi:hypothetical protein